MRIGIFNLCETAHLCLGVSHLCTDLRYCGVRHSGLGEFQGQSQVVNCWFHTVPTWHDFWIAVPRLHWKNWNRIQWQIFTLLYFV